ncbi:unknown protein [Waddlia chondrophila 2032/99]|uniref:Uncharacterized protein n=1 Tax=Waddlia chondrophila 2032/99 TaxID=765953 RepID=F8LB61_9BACT|nr:unknown protein [Waddlia chondrophila 2032/99]
MMARLKKVTAGRRVEGGGGKKGGLR